MTTRASQGEFGKALRAVDLSLYVYRPEDPRGRESVGNRKPCDFMTWVAGSPPTAQWFEVKDVDAVDRFAFAEFQPAQIAGIATARRLGIPYWVAIYWRRAKMWTISDGIRMLEWRAEVSQGRVQATPTSIPRELLMSRFGVDSTNQQLSSTLKAVLLGDVG
jgi:hypothetical protein